MLRNQCYLKIWGNFFQNFFLKIPKCLLSKYTENFSTSNFSKTNSILTTTGDGAQLASSPRRFRHGDIQSGLMSFRHQAKGILFGDNVTNWLLGLRPSNWKSLLVIGTVDPIWLPSLQSAWSNIMTNQSSLSVPGGVGDFDVCIT